MQLPMSADWQLLQLSECLTAQVSCGADEVFQDSRHTKQGYNYVNG